MGLGVRGSGFRGLGFSASIQEQLSNIHNMDIYGP